MLYNSVETWILCFPFKVSSEVLCVKKIFWLKYLLLVIECLGHQARGLFSGQWIIDPHRLKGPIDNSVLLLAF